MQKTFRCAVLKYTLVSKMICKLVFLSLSILYLSLTSVDITSAWIVRNIKNIKNKEIYSTHFKFLISYSLILILVLIKNKKTHYIFKSLLLLSYSCHIYYIPTTIPFFLPSPKTFLSPHFSPRPTHAISSLRKEQAF